MFKNSSPQFGYIFIALCCISNAISFVFIAHINKSYDEMLSIVMVFSYATLLFNLFNFKCLGSLYRNLSKNYMAALLMNVATLFNWVGSFLSLSYIDPATAICINLSTVAITTFFIWIPFNKIQQNKHLLLAILLIIGSMILIINQHASTVMHSNLKAIALGVGYSVASGIAGGFVGIYSEKLSKSGFSVSQILATRFYLLIIVCGIILAFTAAHEVIAIDWKFYFLSSIIIVFFPLVMYQAAIKALGSLIVSIVEPFTPVITYFIQISVGGYQLNWLTVLLLLIASGSVIWLIRLEQNLAAQRQALLTE